MTATLAGADTTPPDTLIAGAPLAVTNLTTASFSFSSTESGSTFACKLDSGTFVSCSSPQNYAGLAAGSHTFQVRATDANGNTDPTPASYNWTIDLSAPDTTITSGPSGTITTNSATFDWTGSDNVTAVGSLQYAYRLDPIEPSFSAFGAATSKSYNNLANGNYTFLVMAKDQATNVDSTPASRALTVNVDTVSPSLSITSHSNNQTVTSSPVTIAGTASDAGLGNNGITSVTVNGVAASSGSAVGSATANWSQSVSLNPGANTITVIANDNSANQNSSTVQINLNYQPADTTAPAAVSNLAAGSATANSVLLSWTAPGDDGNSGTATSYDIRYGLAPIVEANWGAALQAMGEPVPLMAGSAQSFSLTGLSCGTTYFFALKSADEVPNLSAISNSPSAVTLPCPDTSAPETGITSGPSGTIAVNNVTFTWTGTDNVTAMANLLFAYRLDPIEASFSAFGSATSRTYSNLPNGTYTFLVQARDGANNVDLSPASQSFTVNVPPVASIQVTAPNGGEVWSSNSRRTIQWISSNVSGNVSIQLSRDGGASWTTITSSTANDGAHTWKLSKPVTTAARIRVCSVSNVGLCDTSDGNFAIQ